MFALTDIVAVDNDRDDLGDLTELTHSIADHGIDTHPKVTQYPGLPEGAVRIVYGHRRCAAAELAGLTHIEVIVAYGDNPAGGLDDEEIDRQRGEENLNRLDLKPMEAARLFGRRARKVNPETGRQYTVQQVADFYSQSQGQVSKRLALLQLDENVQVMVDQGVINPTDAYYLSQLHEHPGEIQRIVDAFGAGILGVSIERAVKDARVELGVVARSTGRPPRKARTPDSEPAPPPAEVAPILSLPNQPPPPPPARRRGLPWSERDWVTLQVRVPADAYERAVRAKWRGGRYGLAKYWAERVTEDIDSHLPRKGEQAESEGH